MFAHGLTFQRQSQKNYLVFALLARIQKKPGSYSWKGFWNNSILPTPYRGAISEQLTNRVGKAQNAFHLFFCNKTSSWLFGFFSFGTQGGRTWQPFVGSKNGNENFRQARIYNFRVKCVVFARNRKFAKLTQWNMQYIPCNSALLAQEILFLTQKGTFFAQRSPKSA